MEFLFGQKKIILSQPPRLVDEGVFCLNIDDNWKEHRFYQPRKEALLEKLT